MYNEYRCPWMAKYAEMDSLILFPCFERRTDFLIDSVVKDGNTKPIMYFCTAPVPTDGMLR